jgi:RHS repeat-associated protein
MSVANYYFGGKLVGHSNSGSVSIVSSDRLGSIGKFYPYGQEKPSATTNGTEKFTGYFRDSETGFDYADQRYHNPGTGRFLTPDPYVAMSSNASNPSDPGSWNRYAYTRGDPVNRIDPGGMKDCAPGDPLPCSITVTGSGGGGIGGGGGSGPGCLARSKAEPVCPEPDPPGGPGDPGSDEGSNQSLLLSIETALNAALANPLCASVFGTPGLLSPTATATQILDSLIASAQPGATASPYGSIQFSDTLGVDAETSTTPWARFKHSLGLPVSSTITVSTIWNIGNGQPGYGYFNTSTINAESTILHELGHVLTNLDWKGGIQPDKQDTSATNTTTIMNACGSALQQANKQ